MIAGHWSLASRILLSDRAERSIDAQYYLISNDVTSYLFLDALLSAADRGIRVRLLLDDILTSGYDRGMAALNAHPNVEIRLFNPFVHRNWRIQHPEWQGLADAVVRAEKRDELKLRKNTQTQR